MKPISAIIAMLAMLVVSGWSCDRNSEEFDYGNFRYDVVTYVGYEGTTASFLRTGRDNSSAVMLRAQLSAEPKLSARERVLLYYYPQGEVSGSELPVVVRTITKIVNGQVKVVDDRGMDTLVCEPMMLRSLWRTWQYVNVHCEWPYTGVAREFALVAHDATVDNDTVHCYLVHNMGGATTYFDRTCYASFDVMELLQKPGCKVIAVHLNDKIRPDTEVYYLPAE